MLGSFFALIITICFYSIRRVLSFTDCCNSIPEGFKAMVPAILILTFAWTLKIMTESLGANKFVAGLVGGVSGPLLGLFPAIIFLVGAFLAFATGTSWGTFGILIPIVVNIFSGTNHTMMIISISACMAGAVCGDHCSPISDTTIMASAGAQCNHMNHVSTQLPYVVLVAAISCLTYIIAGFVRNPVVPFIIGALILIGTFVGIKYIIKYITRTDKANEQAGSQGRPKEFYFSQTLCLRMIELFFIINSIPDGRLCSRLFAINKIYNPLTNINNPNYIYKNIN